jgi:hypothetical protein
MLDVVQAQPGEQGRLGVALGDDQPAFGDAREQVGDERLLEVLDLPLVAVVELQPARPLAEVLDRERLG